MVVGVNDDKLTASQPICTAASCTTNCIAPVIQVVLKELGIEKGMITTVSVQGGGEVGVLGVCASVCVCAPDARVLRRS